MKKMIYLMLCLLLMSAAPIHAESKKSTATNKTEQLSTIPADWLMTKQP